MPGVAHRAQRSRGLGHDRVGRRHRGPLCGAAESREPPSDRGRRPVAEHAASCRSRCWSKGAGQPLVFEREYTPHGVVIGVDRERHLAFTLRWSGMAPGAAGELARSCARPRRVGRRASARRSRAGRCRRSRWSMPRASGGAIGSQVAAFVPVRRGWDGRLPAAGWMGRSEWDGWRALDDLPRASDPPVGLPRVGQSQPRAHGASSRRVHVATPGRRSPSRTPRGFSTTSSPGTLSVSSRCWRACAAERADVEEVRQRLLTWNRQVTADSMDATVYVTWERLAQTDARRVAGARRAG